MKENKNQVLEEKLLKWYHLAFSGKAWRLHSFTNKFTLSGVFGFEKEGKTKDISVLHRKLQ